MGRLTLSLCAAERLSGTYQLKGQTFLIHCPPILVDQRLTEIAKGVKRGWLYAMPFNSRRSVHLPNGLTSKRSSLLSFNKPYSDRRAGVRRKSFNIGDSPDSYEGRTGINMMQGLTMTANPQLIHRGTPDHAAERVYFSLKMPVHL